MADVEVGELRIITVTEMVENPRTLTISSVENTDFGPETEISIHGPKGALYGHMFVPVPELVRVAWDIITQYDKNYNPGGGDPSL
jgi:hypothetical protein